MSLKISRVLHAGYIFECENTKIAFDPIFENPFSRNCYAFPAVEFDQEQIRDLRLSAVFISHFHDDHCSLESLDLLDRRTPIYIYCVFEEIFELIRELGFTQVYSLELNAPVKVGEFEVIPWRALDAEVDSIFQIRAKGLNILNVVDSWIDSVTLADLVAMKPWDLILWPFQTMRELEVLSPLRASLPSLSLPSEWIEQLQMLNPRYVVPSSCQFQQESWSWYNIAFFPVTYQQFKVEIEMALPKAKVIRMNPSVSIELDSDYLKVSSPLGWVRPVGDQNVDYRYDPPAKPPSTSEIARHFPPLHPSQMKHALDYCCHGLIEKYQSMDPPLEKYFEKRRLWCLSVFDHHGVSTKFFYHIQANQIEVVSESALPLTWTTEVPLVKLYAALELGESLTSMYVRINDQVFSRDIEEQVSSADIVDDPLVRCLFNGVFGAYQRAQLKRLGKRSASR